MTNFGMELHGFDGLGRKLTRMAKEMPHMSNEVMYKWAQQTRAILKRPYPPKNTQKMKWASVKQRIYVMAAIRRGDIQVPYRRTGGIANRWSAKRIPNGVLIRNSAKYAVYVVGNVKGEPNSQYWMHRSRWYIARQEVNKQMPKLTKMLKAEILKEWKR